MAELFSNKLKSWLKSPGKKTYADIQQVFGEKSFGVVFILLMITAALPIPTGGITHVFEVITMLIAFEMIAGRRNLWFPKWWKRRTINPALTKTALPKLVGFINWFELRSKKRLVDLLNNNWSLRVIGIVIFILTLGALLAPPFSALDTLPAMGVVLISLSLILEDAAMLIVGTAIGTVGVLVELSLGSLIVKFIAGL